MKNREPAFLPEEKWLGVIEHAPLVAIDLIISDNDHRILLGKRKNAPAKGFWFTPGSAIRKNESLEAAFRRCLREEIGVTVSHRRLDYPVHVYEHIYTDNFKNDNFGTHYVVLAHRLSISDFASQADMPPLQHSDYKWWDLDDLMKHEEVHENVKDYFRRY